MKKLLKYVEKGSFRLASKWDEMRFEWEIMTFKYELGKTYLF